MRIEHTESSDSADRDPAATPASWVARLWGLVIALLYALILLVLFLPLTIAGFMDLHLRSGSSLGEGLGSMAGGYWEVLTFTY